MCVSTLSRRWALPVVCLALWVPALAFGRGIDFAAEQTAQLSLIGSLVATAWAILRDWVVVLLAVAFAIKGFWEFMFRGQDVVLLVVHLVLALSVLAVPGIVQQFGAIVAVP